MSLKGGFLVDGKMLVYLTGSKFHIVGMATKKLDMGGGWVNGPLVLLVLTLYILRWMGGSRPASAVSYREVHSGKYVPYRNSLLTMVLRDSLGKPFSLLDVSARFSKTKMFYLIFAYLNIP